MASCTAREGLAQTLTMWRSSSKKELTLWTLILCFLAFGSGALLVKRLRPAGPIEFHELPPSAVATPDTKPASNYGYREPTQTQVSSSPSSPQVATASGNQIEPTPKSSRGKSKAEPEPQSISINSGDLTELEKLPGVGPGLAQKIIDYRAEHGAFQSVDELRNVKGIGEKRLAKISGYVRL